jgi:hypothetical protein
VRRPLGRLAWVGCAGAWPGPRRRTPRCGKSSGGRPKVSGCGTAVASSWDRLHPRLTHRTCWLYHHGELPIIEGTLIRLQVDHPPGDRDPEPGWLWSSRTGTTAADVDRWWQSFLRRFDLEHTFRLFKQTLGWTRPKLRTPKAADRWTLAGHRLPHPAAPRPEVGRRPPSPLGAPRRPGPPHPRSGPPRVPEHPREDHPSG